MYAKLHVFRCLLPVASPQLFNRIFFYRQSDKYNEQRQRTHHIYTLVIGARRRRRRRRCNDGGFLLSFNTVWTDSSNTKSSDKPKPANRTHLPVPFLRHLGREQQLIDQAEQHQQIEAQVRQARGHEGHRLERLLAAVPRRWRGCRGCHADTAIAVRRRAVAVRLLGGRGGRMAAILL